jgi:hypothetical protein
VNSYRIAKENDDVPPATPPPADSTRPPSAPAAPVASGAMADTPVIKADGAGPAWTAPAHWRTKPASAMRKASYEVVGEAGAIGDVSITAFPGDVGGELANVNRWRGQLQLPPLADSALSTAVAHRDQNGLHFTVVDFTGASSASGQRMLGAIVPLNGATWFFKLTGPEPLVAREKPAFLQFLDSLRAPETP